MPPLVDAHLQQIETRKSLVAIEGTPLQMMERRDLRRSFISKKLFPSGRESACGAAVYKVAVIGDDGEVGAPQRRVITHPARIGIVPAVDLAATTALCRNGLQDRLGLIAGRSVRHGQQIPAGV